MTATVVDFFRAVDVRDWDTVRALLADEVTLDYVSLFGGEAEIVAADEVVQRWRALLPGFDATQHLLGLLAESGPVVRGNVRGYHLLDGEEWMVAGWYDLTLTAAGTPRIAGIALTVA
ncbi:nuclear transport factor 2 family protein [Actinoplanes xinjiangensis]|uniref:nuclear transport factor 2 family protein n=1 Tax=Actinoplanes xinjiangensis TaxID=512350 RepID=UPI00343EA753